jgi:hypothetical protein
MILNQCCSETLLKIVFQQYRPKADKIADISICPLSANRDWTRCSKKHRYSITSSANASSVAGTVMPSASAVRIFTMNSNLVACRIGRSVGFSPLRTRPYRYRPDDRPRSGSRRNSLARQLRQTLERHR